MPQKPLDSEYECGRLVARQQPLWLPACAAGLIKYDNSICFENDDEVIEYKSIDDLFISNTVDNICLAGDWEKITEIIVNDSFVLSYKDDLLYMCEEYGISI